MKRNKITLSDLRKKYQSLVPAKQKGINIWSMKKIDLIKLIQTVEGNSPCFHGVFAKSCGITECAWRNICQK